jgi:hypothetical protein
VWVCSIPAVVQRVGFEGIPALLEVWVVTGYMSRVGRQQAMRIPRDRVARDVYFAPATAFGPDCRDGRVPGGLRPGRLGMVQRDCRRVWEPVGEQLDKDVENGLPDIYQHDTGTKKQGKRSK